LQITAKLLLLLAALNDKGGMMPVGEEDDFTPFFIMAECRCCLTMPAADEDGADAAFCVWPLPIR
jgi:hypothetical protein